VKHLKENNETYCSHFIFAYKIALHLYLSSMFLVVHAACPFWEIPTAYNLEATCKKIQEWNDYADRRKNNK